MAVKITISIDQNSQSISANTSNVTVTVRASWTYGSYNALQKSGWLKIDGTTYNFTSSFNTGQTTSGVQTLFSKTVNVAHNSNGAKTLSCSASYTSGVSSGTVTASASKTLTTIPRASSLTASNGTLGTAQTLAITRADSSFKHKITYTCGDASGYAAGSASAFSTATSISWTPPISLSSQNTTGTSVSITLILKTYTSAGVQIGTKTKSISCAIPASVKPSCSVTVTDPTGISDTYGNPVKGLSKFKVVVTPVTSYGSAIASYKTTANSTTYTAASFTTGLLAKSGNLSVSATVTDKRGRSGSASVSKTVLDYLPPVIIKLAVIRCNENGTANDQGEFVQVSFKAAVTTLNNLNTAAYTLKYKRSLDADYTEVGLDEYAGAYEVDGSYIFAADTGSSYNVEFYATDSHNETKRTTTASTGFVLMHFNSAGTGIGLGKVAELQDGLDVGLDVRFNAPVCGNVMGLNRLPQIPAYSDLNEYMETGSYAVYRNDEASTISNMPVKRAGRLEVYSATGEGIRISEWSYIRQKFYPYNSSNAVWERDITRGEDNVWTFYNWWQSSLTPLASEKVYDKAAMTIALSANATLGVVNTYTQIPLDKSVVTTSGRLTISSNSIRVGDNIEYVKVSGQAILKCGTATGNRHLRVQKVSGSTTTSHAWTCVYGTASSNTAYVCTPVIVPVKAGDLLKMVYYTSDSADMIASGSATNGWQTYMTVEEL